MSEEGRPDGAVRVAWAAVGVLGLTAWALSFAAPAGAFPALRPDLMAAAVAVAGLLPGQRPHGWLVAALAATGLGATLSALPGQPQWAVIVVAVLDALQTVAAFVAAGSSGVVRRARADTAERDQEYERYLREYQAYVDYYGHPPPDQDPMVGASGQAAGQAGGTAAARDAMSARYASSWDVAAPAGEPGAVDDAAGHRPRADPGLPGAGHGERARDPGPARAGGQEVRRPSGF